MTRYLLLTAVLCAVSGYYGSMLHHDTTRYVMVENQVAVCQALPDLIKSSKMVRRSQNILEAAIPASALREVKP